MSGHSIGVDWMDPEDEEQRERFIAGRLARAEELREEAFLHRSRADRAEREAREYERRAQELVAGREGART